MVIWVGVQGKAAKLGMFGAYHTFMGRRDRARHCFQRALKYEPDHFQALYYLGMDYAADKQFIKAAACYDPACIKDPKIPMSYFALGVYAMIWIGMNRL